MAHYRWTLRTIGRNLSGYYWDLKSGIRNLFVFFPAVWRFRNFDYTGMLRLMEIAAKRMRAKQLMDCEHNDTKKCVRHLTIVAALCKRLREEEYVTMHDWELAKSASESKMLLDRISFSENNDAKYLGKMMQNIQRWWT